MLLALAAHQREPSPQTLGALQIALTRAGPLLGWLGYGTEYIDVEWITEDRLVGARLDGLDLFDLGTGQILDSLDGDIGRGVRTPVTEKNTATSRVAVPTGAVVVTKVRLRFVPMSVRTLRISSLPVASRNVIDTWELSNCRRFRGPRFTVPETISW